MVSLFHRFRIIALICIVFPAVTSATKCYECFGLYCDKTTASIVDCPTSMCFLLSFEMTNSYRSCYQPGGNMLLRCNANRFTRCRVCKGALCNDWGMVNTDMEISCRRCPKGICRKEDSNVMFFRKCPLFRNPEMPRCFTLVDRLTEEYTFGCANEMTLDEGKICKNDWFQSICRVCDTPNCNTEFFIGPDGTNLRCNIAANGQKRNCNKGSNEFPYFGCYIGNLNSLNDYTYGCLTELFQSDTDERYLELFSAQFLSKTILVCFTNDCNKKFKSNAVGLTTCGYTYCGTFGTEAARCGQFTYITEAGKSVAEVKCMSRYHCWRQSECPISCYNTGPGEQLGSSCMDKDRIECYTCDDCPQVNSESGSLKRICAINTKTCLTIVQGRRVIRGCGEGELKEMCRKDDDNCETCTLSACNNETLAVFCHQCNHFDPMCPYEQQDTLVAPCDYEDDELSLDDPIVCYSGITRDNRIERGCIRESMDCPSSQFSVCNKCSTNFCNRESYVFAPCITCEGGFEDQCANNSTYLAGLVPTKSCRMGYETPHCYTIIRMAKVYRGCVVDNNYHEIMKYTCTSYEECLFCDFGQNCNYFELHLRVKKKLQ